MIALTGAQANNTLDQGPYAAMAFFQIFGLYWVGNFFFAGLQCNFAGTIASWYFARNKGVVQNHSFRALLWAFTYHIGSLAFGSLILATIQFLRFLARLAESNHRGAIMFVLLCIRLILSCLENFIRWLSRYAYVYIAMHGMTFCEGARATFSLWDRSGFQCVINDSVVGFVIFAAAFSGSALVGAAAYGGCVAVGLDWQSSLIGAVIVFAMACFIFGLLGASVSVSVDTLMVCYVEDLERNRAAQGCCYSADWHQAIVSRCGTAGYKPVYVQY